MKYFPLLLFLWLSFSSVTAQSVPPVDSLNTDSLRVKKDDGGTQLQGPIHYEADDIVLSDSGNVIELVGNAHIHYMNMDLRAAYIRLNQRSKMLYANGLADSIGADGQPVVTGRPVFKDKDQDPITGDSIMYNFSTRRGRVIMGKTQMEPGYYRGEQIHRIADSTLLVCNGLFTSCEYIDHPHFYFESKNIRIKIKDKIVARPITFYIADIPLAWFPFGVFPNKRGRHSGIVIPKYGEGASTGRFLRSFGYYWAPNDYFDAAFLMDYYDRIGFAFRTNLRYNVRYKLNGRFNGEYFPRDPTTGRRVERWRFRFSHSQIIDPTLTLSGNGSFSSDKQFARQLSPSQQDRLNQNITSNLTLRKQWKKSQSSLVVNLSRNENLQTGSTSYTLPNIIFNTSTKNLYELFGGQKVGARRKWYQDIYMSFNSRLIHRGSRTVLSDSTVQTASTQGIRHSLGFSTSQKIFRYITISPSLSMTEDWVDEIIAAEYDPQTKTIVEKKKKQFAARHLFNTSVRVKTTLYGLFEPNLGRLKFIRHKLDPSLSLTYTPDFSSDFYGYFTRIDTNGVVQKIDKFKKSPFGGTPAGRSQRLNISVNNFFQGKWVDKDGKENKFNILKANFSTSYNFLADSLKWSDISGRFSTTILGRTFSFNTVYTMYQLNANNRKINRFNKLPRLLYLSTSMSFRLNERMFSKKKKKSRTATIDSLQRQYQNEGILHTEDYDFQEDDEYIRQAKEIKMPWSLAFNLTYTYDRRRAKDDRHRFSLTSNASIQLTRNWKISWNAVFDVKNLDISSQNFSIYRDLHCWEMSFNWQPEIGYYFFQINVKASALQDIKVTKRQTSRFRYSGYY